MGEPNPYLRALFYFASHDAKQSPFICMRSRQVKRALYYKQARVNGIYSMYHLFGHSTETFGS